MNKMNCSVMLMIHVGQQTQVVLLWHRYHRVWMDSPRDVLLTTGPCYRRGIAALDGQAESLLEEQM